MVFRVQNTKADLVHSAKPAYDLNPIDAAYKLLEEVKIEGVMGTDGPLSKQTMLRVVLPLGGKYRHRINAKALDPRRSNHLRTLKEILQFVPQHKKY